MNRLEKSLLETLHKIAQNVSLPHYNKLEQLNEAKKQAEGVAIFAGIAFASSIKKPSTFNRAYMNFQFAISQAIEIETTKGVNQP
jgi:hypothetical protein